MTYRSIAGLLLLGSLCLCGLGWWLRPTAPWANILLLNGGMLTVFLVLLLLTVLLRWKQASRLKPMD
jgi:hypothetical protein